MKELDTHSSMTKYTHPVSSYTSSSSTMFGCFNLQQTEYVLITKPSQVKKVKACNLGQAEEMGQNSSDER